MGCLKLSYYQTPELKIISSKKVLTFIKTENKERSSYLFGFNGKEQDPEFKGKHNVQDYGFRMNDTRYGRFFTVDPLRAKYPMLSTYQFASNSPIANSDLDGLEAKLSIYQWNQDGSALNHNATHYDVDPNNPNENPWAKGKGVGKYDYMAVILNNDGTIQSIDIFKNAAINSTQKVMEATVGEAANIIVKPIMKAKPVRSGLGVNFSSKVKGIGVELEGEMAGVTENSFQISGRAEAVADAAGLNKEASFDKVKQGIADPEVTGYLLMQFDENNIPNDNQTNWGGTPNVQVTNQVHVGGNVGFFAEWNETTSDLKIGVYLNEQPLNVGISKNVEVHVPVVEKTSKNYECD